MKKRFHQVISTVAIASTLIVGASPIMAYADASFTAAEAPSYAITDITNAQVKSVLQEKTPDGWRIGSVIRLSNTSGAIVRIPDFELRAKAADGTVYTLQPSTTNARSISPQSSVELSYMAELDAKQEIALTDLLWVDVDMTVYPKVEKTLADAPIGSLVWKGSDAVVPDAAMLKWGDSFSLPMENSALKYAAAGLTTQFAGQSPVYVVQLTVENPGSYTETVPDFAIGAKTDGQTYVGKRTETASMTLNPGEKKYINFAVTTEPGQQLKAFYVMTPATYMKTGQTAPLTYYTGSIGFQLPAADNAAVSLPPYELGQQIAIDPVSQAVSPQLAASLVSIEWFENEGQSYKTVIAKLKFTNQSDSPLPLPELAADLVNGSGISYSGTRTASAVKEVLPGLGALATYAITVPSSESTSSYTFRLLEQQGTSGYKSPIAQLPVTVQQTTPGTVDLALYPYALKLKSWALSNVISQNPATLKYNYTYKLNADVDIQTNDQVVADAANPKLFIQLENAAGLRLAYKSFALSGDNRLMSGSQTIYFDNVTSDSLESPLTLKIYETQSTPLGDARRLLAELKQ
ncbi:hypothetical protein [Paenibacillus hamazuiensis]|uniref:hypothetical protein n=1 Tax=Paenibacillus hamazuiensis TaxID=2936508 RepID=UPI00200D68D8|nr:hypothetical protein [Paenibacillus hamazuiensis]